MSDVPAPEIAPPMVSEPCGAATSIVGEPAAGSDTAPLSVSVLMPSNRKLPSAVTWLATVNVPPDMTRALAPSVSVPVPSGPAVTVAPAVDGVLDWAMISPVPGSMA